MSKLESTKKYTASWVNNKKSITSGECNSESLISILLAAKPQSKNIQFREKGTTSFDPDTNKDVIFPGFQVKIKLSDENAKLVLRNLKLSKGVFPFDFKAGLEKSENGTSLIIETKGDYAREIMKNPRYTGAVNVSAYAQYSVFRGLARSFASNSTYQFNKEKPPIFADNSHPNAGNINDFLLLSAKTYVPTDQRVDQILFETLTTKDTKDLVTLFDNSLNKPAKIRELREQLVFSLANKNEDSLTRLKEASPTEEVRSLKRG